MEGLLWKWTNYWSGWQPRWFILDDGILSYYNSRDEVASGSKGSIKISICDIVVNTDDTTRLDLTITGEQYYFLKAANSKERQQWLMAIGSCKASLQTMSNPIRYKITTDCSLKLQITMEGLLRKWTNYWSGWQPRWFILADGILSYYNSRDEVASEPKGSIKMSVCDVVVNTDDATRLDLTITGEQSYSLKAADSKERHQWLIAITNCKASLQTMSNPIGYKSTTDTPSESEVKVRIRSPPSTDCKQIVEDVMENISDSIPDIDTESDDAERNEKKSKQADTGRNEKKSRRDVTHINNIITQSDMSPPSTSDAVQSRYDRVRLPWDVDFPEKVSKVNCALVVNIKEGDELISKICVLTTFHTIITGQALDLVRKTTENPPPRTEGDLFTQFDAFLKHRTGADSLTQPQQIKQYINDLNRGMKQQNSGFAPQISRLSATDKERQVVDIPIKSVIAGVFTKDDGCMDAVLLELDMEHHKESKIQALTNVKLPGHDTHLPVTFIQRYLNLPDSIERFFAEREKWIYLHSSDITIDLPQTKPDRIAGKARLYTSNKRDIDCGDSGSPIYERGNLATGKPVARLIGMVVTKHTDDPYGGSIFMTNVIVKALKSSLGSDVQIDLLRPMVKDQKPQSEEVVNSAESSILVLEAPDTDFPEDDRVAPVKNEWIMAPPMENEWRMWTPVRRSSC